MVWAPVWRQEKNKVPAPAIRQREKILSFSYFLFYSSPSQVGWSPPTQMWISSGNTLTNIPTNNVWPDIWAPHGPVKLIYKISHPKGEGKCNPPDAQSRGSRVSNGHHTALMIPIMSLYCQLNFFNYEAIKPSLPIGGLSDYLHFPGRVSVLRSRGDT